QVMSIPSMYSATTTSMSGIYAVPKLTEKNWVEFKTKTVMSLTAQGLSCHLDGTVKIPKPLPISLDGTKMYLSDGTTEASETDIENNLLYATVSNSVMIQVQSNGSVASVWNAICAIYKLKSDMVHIDT
ncbi:hypothetical protein PAXINDRAFT_36789, partial [Paxillus involutus ATCC 200175]